MIDFFWSNLVWMCLVVFVLVFIETLFVENKTQHGWRVRRQGNGIMVIGILSMFPVFMWVYAVGPSAPIPYGMVKFSTLVFLIGATSWIATASALGLNLLKKIVLK